MRKLTPETALVILFIAILIIVPILAANPFHIGCKHTKHKATTATILAGKHNDIINF